MPAPNRSNLLLMTHEFPPFPGGVARYCASLAAAARRAGHSVTVVAPEHRSQSTADCDTSGIEILRLPVDVFEMRELGVLQRLVEPILRRQRWDIVHLADWPMILAVRTPQSEYARRIASLHGSDIAVLRHSWRARLAGAARRMRGFERYVCNSRFTATLLESAFPRIPRAAIAVAPHGVDARWFEAPSPEALQRLRQRASMHAKGIVKRSPRSRVCRKICGAGRDTCVSATPPMHCARNRWCGRRAKPASVSS